MTHPYDDIIGLPRHVSKRHPPMARADRAAQFAPFAALTGYEALIDETAREKTQRRPRTEEENDLLDRALQQLRVRIDDRPSVTMWCFVPAPGRGDGSYMTISGNLRRMDETLHTVTFTDGRVVDFFDIYALKIEEE